MTKTELFTEYASYHADRRNRICHAFGIPPIVRGMMGLAHLVRVGPVDLAALAAIALLIYYVSIDVRGALISLAVFAILYAVAIRVASQVSGSFHPGVGLSVRRSQARRIEAEISREPGLSTLGPLYIFEEMFDLAATAAL